MKRNDILGALGNIDEKYIAEADSYRPKRRGLQALALAASFALIISLSLYLLLPIGGIPKSLKQYAGNEYFDVIAALESKDGEVTVYPNRLLMLGNLIFSSQNSGITFPTWSDDDLEYEGGIPPTDPPPAAEGYVEVTDNQEAGVVEGDIFKRTQKHIFYIDIESTKEGILPVLRIYSINGEESTSVFECNLFTPEGNRFYYVNHAMYLADDGKTLIYLLNYYDSGRIITQIQYYDVSLPEETSLIRKTAISGSYVTSRLIDDRLMLVTRMNVNKPDYDEPKSFIPSVETEDGTTLLTPDCILIPEMVDDKSYVIISTVNENGELIDAEALLSYSGVIYSTDEAVYAVHNYTDVKKYGSILLGDCTSDITRFEFTETGLERRRTYTVEGEVLNQYSLDENDGVLRVVTTVERVAMEYGDYGFSIVDFEGYNKGSSASLYCIDISSGKTVASIECFAPFGEEVTSARFEGDMLYVCTAKLITLTDPVFFFDLSDINNITSTDTGVIEGFSTSLIDYGDGMLLGAGSLGWSNFKLELYTNGDGSVLSLDTYIYDGYVNQDYKGYLIDRERDLFGFIGSSYTNLQRIYEYKLVGIENGELTEKKSITVNEAKQGNTRAVIIDGYLYILSGKQFVVEPIY